MSNESTISPPKEPLDRYKLLVTANGVEISDMENAEAWIQTNEPVSVDP